MERKALTAESPSFQTEWCFLTQIFNPYGHDNLFTYLSTNEPEWKACRKAFAKSMSLESIRCSLLPVWASGRADSLHKVTPRMPCYGPTTY